MGLSSNIDKAYCHKDDSSKLIKHFQQVPNLSTLNKNAKVEQFLNQNELMS